MILTLSFICSYPLIGALTGWFNCAYAWTLLKKSGHTSKWKIAHTVLSWSLGTWVIFVTRSLVSAIFCHLLASDTLVAPCCHQKQSKHLLFLGFTASRNLGITYRDSLNFTPLPATCSQYLATSLASSSYPPPAPSQCRGHKFAHASPWSGMCPFPFLS